jgi:hypothetical protein
MSLYGSKRYENNIKGAIVMKRTMISVMGTLVMGSVIAWAEVPYVFTPHTPAKASEVNANFKALSDKIVTLEQEVANSDGSDNGSGAGNNNEENCWGAPFDYTYSYRASQIGDLISIGGKEYKIVAMPFVEFGTGDHYYIKYPIQINKYGEYISASASIYANYLKAGDSCFKDTLSGQKANITTGYATTYSASMRDTSAGSFMVTNNATIYATIKINQTQINVYIVDYINEVQNTALTAGDYDMRDNIEWSAMSVDNALVDNIKRAMDYVQIVKIP